MDPCGGTVPTDVSPSVKHFANSLLWAQTLYPPSPKRRRTASSGLPCRSSYRSEGWWAWVDSNYRPHAYQACALTRLSYRPVDPPGHWTISRRFFQN